MILLRHSKGYSIRAAFFGERPPMFIGHLPAGYLATRATQSMLGLGGRAILAIGLSASVLPDLDLLWFYLVDNRQHNHHSYLFHFPAFWAVVCLVFWIAGCVLRVPNIGAVALIALINLQLHMLLDSIAGGIRWLWPLSDQDFVMSIVPAGHDWWVWNFVLHWTFALELAVVGAALILFVSRYRSKQR